MATPKFLGPDNVLRETFIFSTTLFNRFFEGQMDSSTVDMQVSINGDPFTSNPDLISFEETSFTIPNPSVFPDGLELQAGVNTIEIRSVYSTTSVSAAALAKVTLIQESDIGFSPTPPTNLSLEQLDGKVSIKAEAVDDSRVVGYNFYCSRFAGGGVSGYSRINLNIQNINAPSQEEVSSLGTLEVDAEIPVDQNGTPIYDPTFYNVQGKQVTQNNVLIQSDFNELLEVPETVTKVRTSTTISSVRVVDFVYFQHIRSGRETSTFPTVPNGDFAATPSTEPLYYVVTTVYYDPNARVEVESYQSIEVSGRPLIITTNLGSLPTVGRQQIVQSLISSIIRVKPEIKVEAGSVTRDTVIDPISNELERVRLIADFVHRAQAFPTLLEIDDPFGSGEPLNVDESSYKLALKQAFFLTSNDEVQNFIDLSFDRLASRHGVTRRLGRRSRGEVTFYTSRTPTSTINIPIGTIVSSGQVRFRTSAFARIPFENIASFFNPTTGRYSVTVSIQAEVDGAQGNVSSGQIRQIVGNSSSLSVINSSSTFGGEDLESNLSLATRSQNELASVDTGTRRGYLKIAAGVPGVVQAQVIEAGDPLMQRDLDTTTGIHRLGKVDIWVQGESEGLVTDNFAFTFQVAQDIQFELVSTPPLLQFRAVDNRLSLDNPIVQMLDIIDLELGLRNISSGQFFNLTNIQILSYDTIQLSSDVVQPTINLTDVILGDYRFRTGNTFILTRQPVRDVTSVEGVQSGILDSTIYQLIRPYSPLREGRSTLAGDYLRITDPGDGTGPSGDLIDVTDEQHVLIGEFSEYLDNLGTNSFTVKVYSQDRTIEYVGPNSSDPNLDYTILEGDQTTAVAIKRVLTGNLLSGQTVSIDYSHAENLTVTYTINLIPQAVQNSIDENRHITADVLAKEAIEVPIDISATVVLNRGEDPAQVDTFIRTDLGSFVDALRLGEPLRLSDVVGIIERVTGVSFIVLDSLQMYRSEDAQVVREQLSTSQLGDTTVISSYSNTLNSVWLVNEELNSATTIGGGNDTNFRGVFKNDIETTLEVVRPDLLAQSKDSTYIIGNEGLNIPGFSDDTTLRAQGYVTTSELQARRVAITQNRILVSLPVGESPGNSEWSVTYTVGVDSGAKNVDPGRAEVLTLGNLEFTFDEDR